MRRPSASLPDLSIKGAVNWPTVAVAFVLNLVVTSIDAFGGTATWWQRVVAVALGTAAMFIVVAVGTLLEPRVPPGSGRSLLAVGTFALAGAVRGALVGGIFVLWKVDSGQGEWPRIIGGVALGLAILTPMSILIDQARRFSATRVQLLSRRASLTVTVDEVDAQIRERESQVISTLHHSLREALAQQSPEASADRLEALVARVIRPLSHDLARVVRNVSAAESPPTGRISWSEIVRAWTGSAPFLPWSTAVLVLLLSAPSLGVEFGPWWAAAFIAIGVPIQALLLMVGNAVLRRVTRTSGVAMRAIITVVAALAVGVVAGLVANGIYLVARATAGLPDAQSPILAVTLIVPLLALPLGVARAVMVAQDQELDRLRAADTDLARHLVRLRQTQWSQQRVLARALHGPVQTLVAAGARHLRASDPGEVEGLARGLEQQFFEALDVEHGGGDRVTWDVGIQRIQATWLGSVDLHVTAPEGVLVALDVDPIGCDVAVEILTEAVGNAVRHGDAERVTVSATLDAGDLSLVVVDDGGRGLTPGRGMGTRLLEDCCTFWERVEEREGVRLEVRLPLGDAPERWTGGT